MKNKKVFYHSVEITDFFCHLEIREIKVGKSKVSKCATLTPLEALGFQFVWIYEFLNIWRLNCTKLSKYKAPKISKKGSFRISKPLGLEINFT